MAKAVKRRRCDGATTSKRASTHLQVLEAVVKRSIRAGRSCSYQLVVLEDVYATLGTTEADFILLLSRSRRMS